MRNFAMMKIACTDLGLAKLLIHTRRPLLLLKLIPKVCFPPNNKPDLANPPQEFELIELLIFSLSFRQTFRNESRFHIVYHDRRPSNGYDDSRHDAARQRRHHQLERHDGSPGDNSLAHLRHQHNRRRQLKFKLHKHNAGNVEQQHKHERWNQPLNHNTTHDTLRSTANRHDCSICRQGDHSARTQHTRA